MEVKIFIVGIVLSFLLCAAFVAYEAHKGRDWKLAAMFMLIVFFIAVLQLVGGLK